MRGRCIDDSTDVQYSTQTYQIASDGTVVTRVCESPEYTWDLYLLHDAGPPVPVVYFESIECGPQTIKEPFFEGQTIIFSSSNTF